MLRQRGRMGFSLVEIIVTITVVAGLMGTAFIGGSNIVNDARHSRAVRDLKHFEAAVTSALFDHPEAAAAIKNNTLTGNLVRLISTVNEYLSADEQIQNPSVALTSEDGNGPLSIIPTSEGTGTYVIFASGKDDPWGTPYYFIFDSANHSLNSSEFHITVISSGPNSSAEIGGIIDSDDIFLLDELINGRVYSAIYDCSTLDGFDNHENGYLLRLAGAGDAFERNTARYTDPTGMNTPSANGKISSSQGKGQATTTTDLATPNLVLTHTSGTVSVGESTVFNAERDGTGLITARSANTSIARVHVDGAIITVTGVSVGTTNITVQCAKTQEYSSGFALYTLTVKKGTPSRPTTSVSEITLDSGRTNTSFTVTRDGNGEIIATSSDTSVATVSVSGTTVTVNSVEGASGSATINVVVGEGKDYLAYTASDVQVNVEVIQENPRTIVEEPVQSGVLTYTGNVQTPSWTNYTGDSDMGVTIGGITSAVNL